MKTFKNLTLGFLAVLTINLVACKVEDPLLNNNVAPLLVDIVGATFGAPFSAKPSVAYPLDIPKVTLSARLLELDKTNILDHTKGIDSIPVAGVKILLTYRTLVKPSVYETGTIGEFTSDANGLITIPTSWDKFMITKGDASNPAALLSDLSWSGTHKGISFTRLSQIQAK
jgi:hypothetical protein